ncbi:MAG: sirohydrochlorin cobaltochelatase [Aminipila sp.]
MKKALLVVSFGTSHKETRDKTIGETEKFLAKEYNDRELRRAFTSGMIMRVLKKRDNMHIDNVEEAMQKLVDDGFIDVLVQPTHIINGDEYEKMVNQIAPFRGLFENIVVGRALLTSSEDYEETCNAILKEVPEVCKDNETALVLMGHGTGHFSDAAYAALDYRFKAMGHSNVFVGTVEGYPEVDMVLKQVKQHSPKKVILLPLMLVAGDHAVNDMAGDEEDSWKVIFEEAGYEVTCILRGLGEFEDIRKIYLKHANIALGEEN